MLKKQEKILLTDIDETVLQWVDPFFNWVETELGINHNRDPNVFEFKDALGCETSDESNAIIRQFNNTYHFGQLDPYPHAKEVIEQLQKEGWEFIAISTCSYSETTQSLREENIKRVFGNAFSEIHCIEYDVGKNATLERFDGTWWVEDNAHWAQSALQYNHKPIIITQPYNATFDHPEIPRVTDWREIYQMVSNSV